VTAGDVGDVVEAVLLEDADVQTRAEAGATAHADAPPATPRTMTILVFMVHPF